MFLITLPQQAIFQLQARIDYSFRDPNVLLYLLSDYLLNYEKTRLMIGNMAILSTSIDIASNLERIQIIRGKQSGLIYSTLLPEDKNSWHAIEKYLFVEEQLYTEFFSRGFALFPATGEPAKVQALFILEAIILDFQAQQNLEGLKDWLSKTTKPLINRAIQLSIMPQMNATLTAQAQLLEAENQTLRHLNTKLQLENHKATQQIKEKMGKNEQLTAANASLREEAVLLREMIRENKKKIEEYERIVTAATAPLKDEEQEPYAPSSKQHHRFY